MIYLLTGYLSSLVILVLFIGAIVYFSDPLKAVNRAFAFFCLGSAIWIVSSAFDPFVSSQAVANALVTLSYIGAPIIALTFVYVSYVFPAEATPSWLWSALGAVVLALLSLIFIPGFIVESVVLHVLPNGYHDVVHGPGFPVYILLFLLAMGWGFAVLVWKITRTAGEVKKQLMLLFWGTLVPLAVTSYFIFFRTLTTENEVAWAGPSFSIVWVVAMLVAIRRYRLLKADLFATEALVLLAMLFALAQLLASKTTAELALKGTMFLFLAAFGLVTIRFTIARRQSLRSTPPREQENA